MTTKNNQWHQEYTVGAGFQTPKGSTTPRGVISPLSTAYNVVSFFQGTITMTYPGTNSSGQTSNVSGQTTINSFPNPLKLPFGSTGYITATATLAHTSPIPQNFHLGMPQVIVTVAGLANAQLVGGRTYAAPTLSVTIPVISASSTASAQSFDISVTAILYGSTL